MLVLVGRMDEGMSHLILLAVPLFVFLGLLIEMTGMARAMVAFLASLLGHVRGGLSYVLVGAMYLVSGISGSKAADMAAVAPVLFPEMKQRGAKPGDLVALLSATGAQTETIPPSLVLITIGVGHRRLHRRSLHRRAAAGRRARRSALRSWCGGATGARICRHVRRASAGEIGRTFVIALPAIALPFVIRAAVVEGVATATEVSTIGIVYSILAGLLIYRQFDWRRLDADADRDRVAVGRHPAHHRRCDRHGLGADPVRLLAAAGGGDDRAARRRRGFLAVSIVAFIILGSVLEGIPAIVLFGPLLFPIARQVGVHEVHYAMVVILAMGIGLFAPPFGVGYYAACAISRINPDEG